MPYLILSELVMPLYVFFINKKSEVKIKWNVKIVDMK